VATKLKVNVWEQLHWECPNCCEDNSGPSWLLRGDTVICIGCKCAFTVSEHYADCRPPKFEGKKATV
jgi:hypothetical protein